MSYLHNHQVIHSDLKSANVLLDANLRAKISDFGLARLRASDGTESGGRSTGSIKWLAPEVFQTGRNTQASDVYAYGMTLWEIVSRKLPFSTGNPRIEVVTAWIRDEKRTETIPAECPEELRVLITQCWEVAERRPNMQSALEQLQRWQKPQDDAHTTELFAYARQARPRVQPESFYADKPQEVSPPTLGKP